MVTILHQIKESGYQILLGDGQFYVDPYDDKATSIMGLVAQLKDDFVAARSLMYRAYYVAGDDREIWSKLLQTVRPVYEFKWEQTAGGRILSWLGNNLARANGIYRQSKADESFHTRVVKGLEPKIPMALVEDKLIAKTLERRLEKLKSSTTNGA